MGRMMMVAHIVDPLGRTTADCGLSNPVTASDVNWNSGRHYYYFRYYISSLCSLQIEISTSLFQFLTDCQLFWKLTSVKLYL